jgi:hypothetical protein
MSWACVNYLLLTFQIQLLTFKGPNILIHGSVALMRKCYFFLLTKLYSLSKMAVLHILDFPAIVLVPIFCDFSSFELRGVTWVSKDWFILLFMFKQQDLNPE